MSEHQPTGLPTSIAAAWNSYREMVIPDVSSPEEIEMFRLSFWGGASAMFFLQMKCLDRGGDATDGDGRRIRDISAEIMAFAGDFETEVS